MIAASVSYHSEDDPLDVGATSTVGVLGTTTMSKEIYQDISMNRRDVIRSAAAMGAVGAIGIPAFSGSAVAEEHEGGIPLCGKLDVFCAIDTSGSLSTSERDNLQAGINAFIDRLPTDGSVTVGTVEFGNDGVRNKNDLQNPGGLTVSVGSPGGNTPMPAVMDISDQALYGDTAARADADKLLVLFTDGGPNYSNVSYAAGYTAPRDSSGDWSTTSGNSTYDGADTASATVSEPEMDETALVAASIKSGAVGGGASQIATVYVGDADTQAMTAGAISSYTDLPTYLASEIATSTDFAIDVELSNVEGLVDQLVAVLAEACEEECPDCPADFVYKFEWTEDEEAEGECAGEFVIYDAHDTVVAPGDLSEISLVSVGCDGDGEPQEACFETSLCEVAVEVKAGRGTESATVTPDEDGQFCVEGITTVKGKRGKEVTHAISYVEFTCPASDE